MLYVHTFLYTNYYDTATNNATWKHRPCKQITTKTLTKSIPQNIPLNKITHPIAIDPLTSTSTVPLLLYARYCMYVVTSILLYVCSYAHYYLL